MNIKKTLERIKKSRKGFSYAVPERDESTFEMENSARGWRSPRYTESKCANIYPEKLRGNRCICMSPEAPENDLYKVLRTQIQQRTQYKGWNTVMVTSANPGEGKTLTAINLSLTFAKDYDHTVLLVDCDLKHQTVRRYMGIESDVGLIDYILYDRSLKDLIIWPGIEKLTLISGGRSIHDSTELLGSPRMKSLVAEMKARYDNRYIFFDMPPLLSRSDAIAFTPLVDCVLIVVEAGKTPLQDVQRALELIPKEKFLGFVLNQKI